MVFFNVQLAIQKSFYIQVGLLPRLAVASWTSNKFSATSVYLSVNFVRYNYRILIFLLQVGRIPVLPILQKRTRFRSASSNPRMKAMRDLLKEFLHSSREDTRKKFAMEFISFTVLDSKFR